ncbi:hypothetical protein K3495_g11619 [Podosphaera aphanis]|nr:hypothetical protein K3495_g11619 [Podosphaera aphanis]
MSNQRNIDGNEDFPMTHEQQNGPSVASEQQSQQPHTPQAGEINLNSIPPALYQSIRDQITRDILAQFQVRQPNNQNFPQNTYSAPPATETFTSATSQASFNYQHSQKKASSWPVWDGSVSSFNAHARQLQIKIEEDKYMLGSDRAICLGIFRSIPSERQPRVLHWFETGGPKGDYSWREFLNHVKEQYEDKQARQTASNLLHRMRMGANQYFSDYLQDFELKLSQSGKTHLDDGTKISQLDTGINATLRQLLLTKSLPENDYQKWVSKVKIIAGRLENTPAYRPNGCSGKRTFYIPQNGSKHFSSPESSRYNQESILDSDGDTKMGGVSSLQVLLTAINSLSGMQQGQDKPSARWRSGQEFKKLSSEGRCIRCEKKGHKTRLCPTYGPARKSADVFHVKSSETVGLKKILAEMTSSINNSNIIEGTEYLSEEDLSGGRINPEQRRVQGRKKVSRNDFGKVLSKMNSNPFLIDCQINSVFYVESLVDTGCLCFAAFSENLVKKNHLPRIRIPDRKLQLAENGNTENVIKYITYANFDIDGRREKIFGYVIKNLAYDVILGKPWMEHNDVVYLSKKRAIRFGSTKNGLIVKEKGWYESHPSTDLRKKIKQITSIARVTGTEFLSLMESAKKRCDTRLFAITMNDISKALEVGKNQSAAEIEERLPLELKSWSHLFIEDDNNTLPPHRVSDMKITLQKDDKGREKSIPWGPLYGMSRDELLVLRKTLTDHLDKGWIRASSSPGGAPVLFVKKPGGGLRFCVDYRALNAISEKDRYPLPLIKETLRSVSKSTWITKVDVRAAFHKLRIREGDEDKTAFRTRFGSFEWLVTPFGLQGAPAAFQRYVNETLGDLLDSFCTAYLDDILIYTTANLEDHWEKVKTVFERLSKAGLTLDPRKCEFAVKKTKYLGFIISLGEGIKVDPEKVQAIKSWEVPTTVKGVRSFLGFANFYREFIPNFSKIVYPLLDLTKKDRAFLWLEEHEESFETLKELFITAPVLALYDPERLTVVEADCSGYVMGACLSQYDQTNTLRPIAYFSRKLSPAESNYEIYDKELLSIISAVKEWRGELMGLKDHFVILSDHKNLQYFMSTRKLSERQVRWSYTLSQFNFELRFRVGKCCQRPDALSRREQDMPVDADDERLKSREIQLIKDSWMEKENEAGNFKANILSASVASMDLLDRNLSHGLPTGGQIFQEAELQLLWDRGCMEDKGLMLMYKSLRNGDRSFPSTLNLKISISECDFDERGVLRFRRLVWVPNWEPLQTALIQKTHDSYITGHPGRDSTYAILSRNFFRQGASSMVRTFCQNCDVCGRSHVWRERKKGLLLPLPVPDRFHSELSIDFMTDLPAKNKSQPRFLMVITDRLLKSCTLEAMNTMSAEDCAERFVQSHYRFHGFPSFLTSDRGSNWVGDFWTHLCKLLKIEQRLSTAFHPETDGSTERMNQEILAYLRAFISYAQYEWPSMLPSAMLAINNRDTVIGLSPFFLTHGYHAEPIHQIPSPVPKMSNPSKRAQEFVERLKDAQEYAQAAMASVQQRMESSANKKRQPQQQFEEGDLVWLNLKNIKTPQLSKKLAWVNSKYRIIKIISPHVVELDVPSKIFPRFHVELLKKDPQNPLPSQISRDMQPSPLINADGENEQTVERIVRAENRPVGRGYRRELLVKWKGFEELNYEPRANFEETEALDKFEAEYGTGDDVGEDVGARTGSTGKRRKRRKG